MERKFTKDLTSNGLHIIHDGRSIGQAYIVNLKHDNRGRSIPDFEGETNAMLWAAAPELYEALEDAVELIEYLINSTPTGKVRNTMCDLNIVARAALKKAKGE